jgi:hypothetical protein
VLQFNGTDEWLHRLEHPVSAGLVRALILPLWRITPGVLSYWAFGFYIAASVWIETWHTSSTA